MMAVQYKIGEITILSGNQNSDLVDANNRFDVAKGLVIHGPDVLPEVVTVEETPDNGFSFNTVQSAGIDVVVGQSEVVTIRRGGWNSIRLHADGIVGDDRVFTLFGLDGILV